MVKNRNARAALTETEENRPSNDELWSRVDKNTFCKRHTEAFPILVRLAKRGSTKAQFLAYMLEILAPHLAQTKEGEKLAKLQIRTNPFKNIKSNHRLYRILALNSDSLVEDAGASPLPLTSLIAALHCIAKPSGKKTSGTALDLMLTAASLENLTKIPYFKKLIVSNTIDLVDSVAHYKPKRDPTVALFKDGSTRPITTICKALSELERLCARPAP